MLIIGSSLGASRNSSNLQSNTFPSHCTNQIDISICRAAQFVGPHNLLRESGYLNNFSMSCTRVYTDTDEDTSKSSDRL